MVFQWDDDDIKGKVLHSKECNYQTPSLKPSKAKQKLNAHEYSRHNKEDLPKAKLEAAENNPEEDCNNLPMVQFAAQKEVLHDVLDGVLDVEQERFCLEGCDSQDEEVNKLLTVIPQSLDER